MKQPHDNPIVHQLGLWYSLYRIFLSGGLAVVYMLTYEQLKNHYDNHTLYFYTSICYLFISLLQCILMRLVKVESNFHLITIFLTDTMVLSLLTFALASGVNLQIGLIYLMTILVSSILLPKNIALMVTLTSIISMSYQSVFINIFDIQHLQILSSNIFLAVLFFMAYRVGRISIERFNILERTALTTSFELEQLQRINQHILQQVEMGYLVINKNMEIILSNPTACKLLGMAELIAHTHYPLQVWQPDFFNFLNQHVKEEYKNIHKNQFNNINKSVQFYYECERSHCKIKVRMQALYSTPENLTLFTLQDNQEINQQVQQLKLASLGQLSASIAHEIRNPLSVIVQANDLLHDELPEDNKMFSELISKQTQRIDKIIHNTLNMAKHENMMPEPIDLSQFLPQVLQEDLNDIQQHIELNIAEQLGIIFDKNQLRQVLINLIRNAVRHNQADKKVIILGRQHTHEYWLDVIDFGDGIDKETQANLFKPFFSTAVNGTGLGLYLSYSFCEANQARLMYVDEIQQGACFRISGVLCKIDAEPANHIDNDDDHD